MLRSHGMVREVKDNKFQKYIKNKYKDLNTQFIFKFPNYFKICKYLFQVTIEWLKYY